MHRNGPTIRQLLLGYLCMSAPVTKERLMEDLRKMSEDIEREGCHVPVDHEEVEAPLEYFQYRGYTQDDSGLISISRFHKKVFNKEFVEDGLFDDTDESTKSILTAYARVLGTPA